MPGGGGGYSNGYYEEYSSPYQTGNTDAQQYSSGRSRDRRAGGYGGLSASQDDGYDGGYDGSYGHDSRSRLPAGSRSRSQNRRVDAMHRVEGILSA